MCPRWRSPTGLATLAVLVVLFGAALVVMTQDYWWGIAALLAHGVFAVCVMTLHDHTHRRHHEKPHAMWGTDDRHKPSFLR